MAPANCSFLSRPPSRPRWHRDSCRAERSLGSLKPSPATATDFIAAERKFTEICIFARLLAELDTPPTMRHHAETSATVIADLGMPNHTFVHGQAPVCILSGALWMSSAAAHWSPAVTELVQLVRTRWRDNCFVGQRNGFNCVSRRADLGKCAIKLLLVVGHDCFCRLIAIHLLRRAVEGLCYFAPSIVRRPHLCWTASDVYRQAGIYIGRI